MDEVADLTAVIGQGKSHVSDISDHDAVQEKAADTEEGCKVVVGVNNVAISEYAWTSELEPGVPHRVLEVNLTGQSNFTRAVTP